MGRNNTKAAKNIAKMYEQLGLAQDDIFHKTKLLLSIYRDVVWATLSDCECVNEEIYYYGDDLNDALIYLEEFAPDIERSEFERRVCNLFENKWMIDLVDKAMSKVYDYYNNRRLYHEILSKSYLTAFRYTESELLEIQAMYLLDLREYRNNRNYATHIQSIEELESDGEESRNVLHRKFLLSMTCKMDLSECGRFGWIDEIENAALYIAISKLTAEQKELLTLLYHDGNSQTEVAMLLHSNPSAINKRV